MRRRPPAHQDPGIPLAALAVSLGIVAAGQAGISLGLAAAHSLGGPQWWTQPLAALVLVAVAAATLPLPRMRRPHPLPYTARVLLRAAAALDVAATLLAGVAMGVAALLR